MPATEFFIDVFHGQLTPNSAQVYGRVADLPGGQDWTLTGTIRGPHCRQARTLPTTYSFSDLGVGESLLASVMLPDPCFWSTDLPALYRVVLELKRNGVTVQKLDRELGLRFLGTRGNSFYVAGKRWVLRAIHGDVVAVTPIEGWREAEAAMVVRDPSDELCQETSHEGVILVVDLGIGSSQVSDPARCDTIQSDIRGGYSAIQFAKWPSVAFVVGKEQDNRLLMCSRHFPSTILVHSGKESKIAPAGFASAIILDVEELGLEEVGKVAQRVPTIAKRHLRGSHSLTDARFACDLLQRDLAPYADCAGYIV